MRDIEFYNWLINIDDRDKRQASDNVSRAKRVEKALTEYIQSEINLDSQYKKDKCTSVIEMLSIDFVMYISMKKKVYFMTSSFDLNYLS